MDVPAIDKRTKRALLIDLTVHFETNDDMGRFVQQENASKYDQCFQDRWHVATRSTETIQFETIGLCFGARGVISSSVLTNQPISNLTSQRIKACQPKLKLAKCPCLVKSSQSQAPQPVPNPDLCVFGALI